MKEDTADFRQVYWIGDAPTKCDITGFPITDEFVDGKVKNGPWANMHPETHEAMGVGLGTGRGQRYKKQPNGSWLKVEG